MGTLHDILFVGTTHGRLLKLSSDSNTLIEALQVFPYHVPVRNILVADDQIIILSDHEVNAFPLQRCATMKSCGDCVALQVNLSECELFFSSVLNSSGFFSFFPFYRIRIVLGIWPMKCASIIGTLSWTEAISYKTSNWDIIQDVLLRNQVIF